MSVFWRPALLLAVLVTGSHAVAADASLPELEKAGQSIHAKDRAARLATDRLRDSEPPPGEVRGWVTLPSEEGWRVFFVQQDGDAHCSRLSVPVDENGAGPLDRSETCRSLRPEERAMYLARRTAISALRDPCSENYNTVILPHEGAEAAWDVYLLAATREAGKVVVGGHVRVLVAEGGSDIVDYRPLSRSCLVLDLPGGEDGEPAALFVTHLLEDHPNETHVFLSLLHDLPFYVITESAMWRVVGGQISLVMDGEDFKAYLEKAKAAAGESGSGD